MRIGLIAPPGVPVPPPAYGGTESVVDRLARGLASAGHEVLLAAAANSTCPVPQVGGGVEASSTAAVCADSVTELRHIIRGYAAMGEVDIVHDHTLTGPLYGHAPGGAPVVTTAHGPFDATLAPVYRAMRGVPVIAISHHQAGTARGFSLVAVIHHGLDVSSVPVGRGEGGYASFLGRMSPEKGAREAALVARAAGVPLLMAAKLRDAGEREYFDTSVKPLLCSDVQFVGELGHDEKLELLGGSFALLDPMQWAEPFGLVMIEAMATGTPVVATPVGSAPELVEDGITGFLRADIPALASALIEASYLGRASCRQAAVQRFNSDRMVAEHLRVYREVLDRGPGRTLSPAGASSTTVASSVTSMLTRVSPSETPSTRSGV